MNSVNLIGRLTKDVDLRFIPSSGMAVANFTMAVDKGLSKAKKEEFESQGKPTADFIRIIVWGKQAENCSQYLSKGKLVAIQGSIQTGSYQKDDGSTAFTVEVLASRVEFLEWGNSKKNEEKPDDDFSFGGAGFNETDDDVPF